MRRNPRYTPLQLQARRAVEKAEIRVRILSYGLSKALKNFYGDSEEMGDILTIAGSDLYNANDALKQAESYYKKITEIKTRNILIHKKVTDKWMKDKRNKKRSKVN
jgi:hypothetical protein